MAAMLTCGDFRNENEWASLTQLRSCGTPQRNGWDGVPQHSALWGAVYETRSQRCGYPIVIRLAYPLRSCINTVLCMMR